jgi:hypothetical protein
VPWVPELFTAPVLERILDERRRDKLVAVPYFAGLMAGDPGPLVESFEGEPEVHDPIRGRVRGVAAFTTYVTESSAWLRQHNASVEDVEHVILDGRGFEEVNLHLDIDTRSITIPIVVVADRRRHGRIDEVRIYFSSRSLTGRPTHQPPLLQPEPGLRISGPVAAYLQALAAGDLDAVGATFEQDGYVRDADGGRHGHGDVGGLSARDQRLSSTDGGIRLEPCGLVDDRRGTLLEYNVIRRGAMPLLSQAGAAVFVPGHSGKLAAVRLYDSLPPLGPES